MSTFFEEKLAILEKNQYDFIWVNKPVVESCTILLQFVHEMFIDFHIEHV